jgi:hypothetical protein
LCNPNETDEKPILTEIQIQQLEALDTFGNSSICGIGYISYGFVCIPASAGKTLGGNCGETIGIMQRDDKVRQEGNETLDEKCERYRQEYEATVREIKFRLNLIRQYQNIMASSEDPEVRETMEGLVINTQAQASLFYAAAQKLLFQAIEEGCYAGLWSPLPILPWAQ